MKQNLFRMTITVGVFKRMNPSTILIRSCAALFTAGLLAIVLSLPQAVQAAPFSFAYTDTILDTSGLGLAIGQDAKITVTLDNGGATTLSQTWTAAHLQSMIFDFNDGGLVTTFNLPFDGGLTSTAGNFETDGVGTLTSVMSSWLDTGVDYDFTSNGSGTLFTWVLNGHNGVYVENVPTYGFVNLEFVGNMTNPVSWSLVSAGPNPVPEPSTMLLLGSGLVGLVGYRMKKAQA